jgi:hypothetical protein
MRLSQESIFLVVAELYFFLREERVMKRYVVLEFDDSNNEFDPPFSDTTHPADSFMRDCEESYFFWSQLGATGYYEMGTWPKETGIWLPFHRPRWRAG